MSELIRKLKEKKYITKIKFPEDISDELLYKEIPQTGSVKIVEEIKKGLKPPYAVMRETNAPLMNIMYRAGLAANENFMTYEEAANVCADDLNTGTGQLTSIFYKYGDLENFKSFDEFQYFTGVEEIKPYTFYISQYPYYISNLKSITIPNSVTKIGDYAFYRCMFLNIQSIPDSVTTIENGAFQGCNYLSEINDYSITIPDSVTTIGSYAFNSTDVKIFYLGKNLTQIGQNALSGAVEQLIISPENTVFDSRDNCNALIETATNTLVQGWKYSSIPDSVTTIGSSAFNSVGLKRIEIPDSVTTIGSSAFSSNSGVNYISIGNSVTEIGENAFTNCGQYQSEYIQLIIPDSVTKIGNYAFQSVKTNSITLSKNLLQIGSNVFNGCYITSIEIPDSVTYIGSSAFSCSSLETIIIGKNLTSIQFGAWASFSSPNIKTITISPENTKYSSPNNCNSIIETATNKFMFGCQNSTIPDSVTTIENGAFSGCTGLTTITIPDSVTSIGYDAFSGCTGLTTITIPDSVTSIGYDAFSQCQKLTFVKLPENLTSISDSLFEDCSGLTTITIPDSVTKIGKDVFEDCSGLTTITIPDSVTSIGSDAFRGCGNLHEITCLAMTAPTVDSYTFGNGSYYYTGRNTYDQGINILKVPTGAAGYDTGYWLDPLQNPDKCGFVIEYI